MRVLPILVLLLAAGCVSPAADLAPANDAGGDALAPRVEAFLGDGTVATLPDLVGEATYVLTGHRGSEPNIGVTKKGSVFVTADDEVLRSRDNGTTWERVYVLGLEKHGAPVDPVSNSDPMLWVDPVTDIVYNDPMFPILACSSLVSSKDDGDSWMERHGVCHPPPMDHQRLGSGVPGPKAPPLAGKLHPTVLYQCYNQIVESVCAMSYDGGLTFAAHAVVANSARDGCGGTTGSPRAGPDGTVAVAMWCDSPEMVALSEDNGLTWRLSKLPDPDGVGWGDPSLAWSPDGTLYAAWSDGGYMHWLARSHDKGATWEGPWRLVPPDVQTTVFGAIAVGADGRLGGVFIGSRDAIEDPSVAPDETRWHVFITTTEDADAAVPTFVTRQVTPDDDPVQVGCVWMRGFTIPQGECRNMADFIDAAIAPDGTLFGVYTEGCTDGCAGNPDAKGGDSRDSQIAIVRLDGWSLLGP